MIKTSRHLNFSCNTEEAFTFYKAVCGGEFSQYYLLFKKCSCGII